MHIQLLINIKASSETLKMSGHVNFLLIIWYFKSLSLKFKSLSLKTTEEKIVKFAKFEVQF